MTSWSDIEREVPELAAAARGFLDAHTHKTIATLRKDGSPRISGIEAAFADGELTFGSMARAVKVADLARDARFALHSASDDPPGWKGDAKVAGRAVQTRSDEKSHHYRADIDEVVVTTLAGDPPDRLVIESWNPRRGYRRVERA